jgi:hypothetical protein
MITFALVVLWFLSVWLGERSGNGFISNLNLFWNAIWSIAPYIASVFAVIALFIHFRLGRAHWLWAYSALIVAAAPWLWNPTAPWLSDLFP